MKSRNSAVDLAKLIASWLVIGIHTALFSDLDDRLYFIIVHVVCRFAVPFFAVCTGYFLTKSLRQEDKSAAIMLRQWKKLIKIYLVWIVVYLLFSIPFWIKSGWFSAWAFIDYIVAACIGGAYYHLWYLWGVIVALPIFYIIVRKIPQKFLIIIILLLWFVKVLTYAYAALIPAVFAGVIAVFSKMGTILCLLPLLLLGAVISGGKCYDKNFYWCGFAVSFVLLFCEAFFLKNCGQEAVSYIFCTLPVAYFLFNGILNSRIVIPEKVSNIAAEISMFIYCIHPIFVKLTETVIQSSISRFAVCATISTVLGYICVLTKQRRKKERKCFS